MRDMELFLDDGSIPQKEKAECPECMGIVYQEELDCFDGLCEDCSGAFDE